MEEIEIINKEFDRLQKEVSYEFFPNFLYNTCIDKNLTSLCYVPSFRKQNNHDVLNYELLLQITLKRILASLEERKSNKPVVIRSLLDKSDIESLKNVINIYSNDLIKKIEVMTEFNIYSLFGFDVVFLNDDLERLFDFLRIVDLYDARIEIIKKVLDVFICKKQAEKMMLVSLKREKDPFYYYSRMFPEYIDVIENYLNQNNCRYLSICDFISQYLNPSLSELLITKINHYSDWVNKLDSGENYTDMLINSWIYFGDTRFTFLEDLQNIYDSEPLKLFDDVNDFKLCGFDALKDYLIHIDVSINRNRNCVSSLFSAEKLFNDIGYLKGVDNTSLVTGYLKSIEQLIGNLIIEDSQKYKYAPSFTKNGKEVVINENTLHDVGMLNNLEKYILFNPFFIKNKEHKVLLANLVKKYRKSHRNGYLHKDAILSYEKVENIRKDTIALTIVILNVYCFKENNSIYSSASISRRKVFNVICKGEVNLMGKPPFICEYNIKMINGKTINYMRCSIEKYRTLFYFNFYYESDKDLIESNNIIYIEKWDDIESYITDERTKDEKECDYLLENSSELFE